MFTITPYFFITSDEPVSAAWRSRNTSASALLLNDARSIASPVNCFDIFVAVAASKPNGTKRSCVPAMKSAICCFERPTCLAKLSDQPLTACAFAPNTTLNLFIVSWRRDAALTAGINAPAIAAPMAIIFIPAALTAAPNARSRARNFFNPRTTRLSSSHISINAAPARTPRAPAINYPSRQCPGFFGRRTRREEP